jgi:predicted O-linked N-acetylglucosamine transferase (SPINDLY family)
LRIGYFSADFHDHATMYLMAKVFEAHDPEKFELYAYSFGPDGNDEMRQRLIKAVDVFDDVKMMNDKDIALLARQDQIDIAVDLKGHTKDSRPGIFAYRAAPIQISYLGYPGTMGADFIDYIIADKVVIPERHEPSYSDSIIHLPHCYQVNDNTRVISNLSMTKFEMGLPEQGFVFCCFNNNYKISPTEFDIWMRLLGKVEGSVIWLLKSNKWVENNLQSEAKKRGVSSDRLIFAEKIPQSEHLARHRLADLFIDTFNYNAHTTASDALWAGLPVVTKLGQGFAARVAGSLLTAIDLPELITETEMEYEALILDLATNPQRLAAIKQKLAANRLSKPLFNTELFTKHLEDGYQQTYQRYFDGLEPDMITVCD